MSRTKASQPPAQADASPQEGEDRVAADLHDLLAGVREQMQFMMREQFAQVEAALRERLAERDGRIAAADAMIERLREESARANGTLEKMRELAREGT